MNEHQELPLISITKLIELLTNLDVHFVLKKNEEVVVSHPEDLCEKIITDEEIDLNYILHDEYHLLVIENNAGGIKDKVRNARHDIYNLINTSLLGFDYIKSKFTLKNDIHRCEVIEKNLNSVTRLLETVFDNTREKPKENFQLNKTLIDLARIFSTAISKEKTFIYSLSDKAFYLSGVKEDIFNSVLNLLINADEATDDDGVIKLSLEVNDHAVITVEDNGKGISEENLNKVFERGFSTKSKKHESGIGLFNVKKIIEEHNGQITIESEEDSFTRFEVNFKRSAESEIQQTRKTILFADDDEMLLELIFDLLSSYDFNVVTVKNGSDLISKFDEKVDLIIADRNMPNLDGISAVKQIRDMDGNTPVIISTGFTKDEAEVDRLKEYQNIYFIDKPYNFEKLLNLINSII